jgi:hypothetical protein
MVFLTKGWENLYVHPLPDETLIGKSPALTCSTFAPHYRCGETSIFQFFVFIIAIAFNQLMLEYGNREVCPCLAIN